MGESRATSLSTLFRGEWHGVHKDFLFEDDLFPVWSAKLLAGQKKLKLHKDLSSYKFIYVTAELRKKDWQLWFEAEKFPEPLKSSRIYFQNTMQALQAAQAGLGFAIAHGSFVLDDIKSGRLIAPFKAKVRSDKRYYLIFPETYLHRNKVKKFRNWIQCNSTYPNFIDRIQVKVTFYLKQYVQWYRQQDPQFLLHYIYYNVKLCYKVLEKHIPFYSQIF